MFYKTLHRNLKITQHELYRVPAPLLAPVVLLLLPII
jgi:hypothetical protein